MDNVTARQTIERKLEVLQKQAEYTFGYRQFDEENDSTADNLCKVIESLFLILSCKRSQRELLLAEVVTATDRLNLAHDPNARQILSGDALLKLRGYSRERFKEFVFKCEQGICETREKNGVKPPIFDGSMFAEIQDAADGDDFAYAFDEKLNEWFAAGVFSTEEIQIILKMIDDAPFAGVALAQSVQG